MGDDQRTGGKIPIGVGAPRPGRESGSWPGIPGQEILVMGVRKNCHPNSRRTKFLAELVAEVQVAVHLGTK